MEPMSAYDHFKSAKTSAQNGLNELARLTADEEGTPDYSETAEIMVPHLLLAVMHASLAKVALEVEMQIAEIQKETWWIEELGI